MILIKTLHKSIRKPILRKLPSPAPHKLPSTRKHNIRINLTKRALEDRTLTQIQIAFLMDDMHAELDCVLAAVLALEEGARGGLLV